MTTKTEQQYLITESQMKAIARLSDAANLLSAALPTSYTTTPIGSLKSLSDAVAMIYIMSKPTTLVEAAGAALYLLEGTADAEDRDGHHNAAINVRNVEKELKTALNR